jgi:hypothetical protein
VGREAAGSSTTAALLQATLVACGNDSGALTTRNHLGSSRDGTVVTWTRYLFVASSTGQSTCSLFGRAATFGSPPSANQPLAPLGTSLTEADDVKTGAAAWTQPSAVQFGQGTTAGPEAAVLARTWDADANSSAVDVIGDVELTTCNQVSSSCTLMGTDSGDVAGGSLVQTSLQVVQRATNGGSCRTTVWPSGPPMQTFISNAVHHMKIYHGGVIALDPSCSRTLDIAVRVRLLSGNFVAVEPGRYTNGIAMNVPAGAAPDTTPPEAPQSLVVTGGNQQAQLRWGDDVATDLARYTLYRTTDPPSSSSRSWTPVATINLGQPTFTDVSLSNGTTYFYRVTATDRAGNESAASTEVSVTPAPPPPPPVPVQKATSTTLTRSSPPFRIVNGFKVITVRRGAGVGLLGRLVSAAPSCSAGQLMRLRSGGHTLRFFTTTSGGSWAFRLISSARAWYQVLYAGSASCTRSYTTSFLINVM